MEENEWTSDSAVLFIFLKDASATGLNLDMDISSPSPGMGEASKWQEVLYLAFTMPETADTHKAPCPPHWVSLKL